jgi:ketosteroid isomerase-like protein
MKSLIFLLLPFCCTSQNLSDYQWLLGTWQQSDIQKEKIITEAWKFEDDAYVGYSNTVKKGKKTFEEKMTIKAHNGNLVYSVFTPENNTWVDFTMSNFDSVGNLFFENKLHDFPKYIQYNLQKDNTIKAEVGDGTNHLNFMYSKINDADSIAIQLVLSKMQLAYHIGMMTDITQYYCDDALITGGNTVIEGHDNIKRYWSTFQVGNWKLTNHWLKTYGDHAVQKGTSKISYPNGTSDIVNFLLNWKKVNGLWKISQDIYW